MEDSKISKYVRAKLNLPDNWRVYQTEASHDFSKVKLTGSLVRPVDRSFEPHILRDFDWIKPISGKRQLTITVDEYNGIFKGLSQ